jgi:hypothetical protein
VQDIIHRLDFFVWRGMEDNDDRSNQTNRTAELAKDAQFLVQEICAEDSSYQDAQGT